MITPKYQNRHATRHKAGPPPWQAVEEFEGMMGQLLVLPRDDVEPLAAPGKPELPSAKVEATGPRAMRGDRRPAFAAPRFNSSNWDH